RVPDATAALERIEAHFASKRPGIDRTDGLSLEFSDWRLNIRPSNTEPLLRLNIESRGRPKLVAQKLAELENLIGKCAPSV
ncbi:MAG TPA: hypothetical protein VJ904_10845, partial [Tichowtungia sp.]|nr:hypothetical protein [Tichowtungia sp.]